MAVSEESIFNKIVECIENKNILFNYHYGLGLNMQMLTQLFIYWISLHCQAIPILSN